MSDVSASSEPEVSAGDARSVTSPRGSGTPKQEAPASGSLGVARVAEQAQAHAETVRSVLLSAMWPETIARHTPQEGVRALDGLLSVVATLQQELANLQAETETMHDREQEAEARVATLQQERDALANENAQAWSDYNDCELDHGRAVRELVAVRERETRLRKAARNVLDERDMDEPRDMFEHRLDQLAALVVSSPPPGAAEEAQSADADVRADAKEEA